jgi:glutaminase
MLDTLPSIAATLRNDPILDYLLELHREIAKVGEGSVATYIPELARANPDWFGICVVTAAGNVYEVGDSQVPFTVQSISKPFVYGMALEDNTRTDVLAKVGVEPTGDAFNAISLEPGTGRPRNPMINAGAIAVAGMIAGKSPQTRLRRVLDSFSIYAGRDLSIDETVYRSEAETGHRNRAIGHMLRNFNILTEPPDPVVDLYFKQCSISVTCRDLATMAATLANRGVNPLTKKQAIRGEYVESVLSVMASCGMYDYAGEWLYRIGMPAKSGVSGGVISVLPGQLGIGVFSPRLDARGNSLRGIKVCDALSRSFDLHSFNSPHNSQAVIRLRFNGSQVNSSRQRSAEESRTLGEFGTRIRAYQLQGSLAFSTCEVIVREILDRMEEVDFLILDLKYVLDINESACRLLHQMGQALKAQGKTIAFSRTQRLSALRRYMKAKLGSRFETDYHSFEDNDIALEWCEERLLQAHLPKSAQDSSRPIDSYDLLRGLTAEEIQHVAAVLEARVYPRNKVIVEAGAAAGEIYFIHRGTATIVLTLASGVQKRLGLFSPGMAFGEVAMLDGARRSATVVAEAEVECHLLKREAFDRLGETHPRIKIVLLTNMALSLARLLRKTTREFSVFDY